MEKKIREAIIIAVVLFIAGINVYHSQNKVAISDVALANVEALAHEEWYNGNCYWVSAAYLLCEPDGNFDPCPCGSYGIN